MRDYMKYVMLRGAGVRANHEWPIIFPGHITHADMAAKFPQSTVVSAGFVDTTYDDTIQAFGMSASLDITSRPEDSELIDTFFSNPPMSVG